MPKYTLLPRSVYVQRVKTVKQSGPQNILGILHHWSKFGDPSLKGFWVIIQTNFELIIG